MNHMEIAKEIVRQLGGSNRLKVMIGAKDFIALAENDSRRGGLCFRIPSNLSRPRISHVEINLNGKDLYDIEFRVVRAGKVKHVGSAKDVYNDQLVNVIESHTGLVLRMPKFVGV